MFIINEAYEIENLPNELSSLIDFIINQSKIYGDNNLT